MNIFKITCEKQGYIIASHNTRDAGTKSGAVRRLIKTKWWVQCTACVSISGGSEPETDNVPRSHKDYNGINNDRHRE